MSKPYRIALEKLKEIYKNCDDSEKGIKEFNDCFEFIQNELEKFETNEIELRTYITHKENEVSNLYHKFIITDKALDIVCSLLENVEKDNCVYCPFGEKICVDKDQHGEGYCRAYKWKDYALKESEKEYE